MTLKQAAAQNLLSKSHATKQFGGNFKFLLMVLIVYSNFQSLFTLNDNNLEQLVIPKFYYVQ